MWRFWFGLLAFHCLRVRWCFLWILSATHNFISNSRCVVQFLHNFRLLLLLRTPRHCWHWHAQRSCLLYLAWSNLKEICRVLSWQFVSRAGMLCFLVCCIFARFHWRQTRWKTNIYIHRRLARLIVLWFIWLNDIFVCRNNLRWHLFPGCAGFASVMSFIVRFCHLFVLALDLRFPLNSLAELDILWCRLF